MLPPANDRPAHGGYPGAVIVKATHSLSDCEAELKASPDYDQFRGKPERFVCSCGRVFDHYDDEAEGDGWVLADGSWLP